MTTDRDSGDECGCEACSETMLDFIRRLFVNDAPPTHLYDPDRGWVHMIWDDARSEWIEPQPAPESPDTIRKRTAHLVQGHPKPGPR
jgi:hypothetical protein